MPRGGDVECSATIGSAAAAGWAYLAEGGAHLVLERRAVADDDPNVAGRVLRLRKTKTPSSSPLVDAGRDATRVVRALAPEANPLLDDALLWKGHPGFEACVTEQDRSWAFVQHVMRPALGARFVDPGAHARVDRAFLEAVATAVAPARPRDRRLNSRIDLDATTAALLRNANALRSREETSSSLHVHRGDWFSVEIKPKCGFVLPGDPKATSRFQMHQLLRARKGEIETRSAYDPLDLFAEDEGRQRRAVLALARSPRNNFRIRRASDDGRTLSRRARFETDAETDDASSGCVFETGLEMESFLDVLIAALRVSGVLREVLRAQRRDRIGAERAYETSAWISDADESKALEAKRVLRDFIVSAVAKDCSAVLAFRKTDETFEEDDETFVVTSRCGASFRCRVSAVDVDLKSIRRLPEWVALHREIKANWEAHGDVGWRAEHGKTA